MNRKICPKCGFSYEYITGMGRCLYCGWQFEDADSAGNIRLQSESDVYYEFAPSKSPLWEDAWGKHFLGKCYSKKDSAFIKEVMVSVISDSVGRGHAYGMWNFLKERNIDFSQTALIPIVDGVGDDPYYLIEDYFEGVSLYDLMHGKVCGADDRPVEFAVKMYDMFCNERFGFAKIVVKEVLRTVKFMLDHEIGVHCIAPPENIFFTESGDIRIRMICSLKGYKANVSIPIEWYFVAFPPEYNGHYVYSVGIFLYSVITGHLPNKGGASLEESHLFHSRCYDPYDDDIKPHLNMYRYDCEDLQLQEISDEYFRKVIEKATNRNPHKRYQSIEEFVKALDVGNDEMKRTRSISCMNMKNLPWYKKVGMFILNTCHLPKLMHKCLLLLVLVCPKSTAQTHMRIHLNGGIHTDVPIEKIDSITFIDGSKLPVDEACLTGSWLWGDAEAGYYELLTFNEDKTYTGYDNYFTYGFDTITYGWYAQMNSMLTLQSNGFGYNRRYNWLMIGLTDNALDVMTKMGHFVYYKLQPEIIYLHLGEEYQSGGETDSFIFADGVTATINESKLKGVKIGTTYAQKYDSESNLILSYKVVVIE